MRLARTARRPLECFLQIEAAGGISLVVVAAAAFAWANSPWRDSYHHLWQTPIGVRVGRFSFERSLEWVVNDGLMAIFFFVVGMEIRREIQAGELSEWRRAALPAAAALGGMLAPAALYLLLAGTPQLRSGWGVPMATDIAFAIGILTLLGKRVPAALRVLLLALAIIDDLGAIVVIAAFYSPGIALSGLALAGAGFAGIFALQRFGVRARFAYFAPSFAAWAGIYAAGIHPTIAGVLVGIMTPARAWMGAGAVAHRESVSPAESLIRALHPWVAFGILPVFALANSGVSVSLDAVDGESWRVIAGVSLGLLLGKPAGVLLAVLVVLRARIATLPRGIETRHLVVLGMVASVGFTMALFVAQLAFADAKLLGAAKLGILVASGGAALISLAVGRLILSDTEPPGAAQIAEKAERSTEP